MDGKKCSRLRGQRPLWLLVASVLLCSGLAQAGCRISSGTGMLDYGRINSQISGGEGGKNQLASRSAAFRVECDEPRQIRLAFNGHSGPQRKFAFGRDGDLEINLSALVLDNNVTAYREISAGGKQTREGELTSGALLPGSEIETTGTGQHLNFVLSVRPVFTDRLFAIQDDYQPGNDITVSLVD